MTQHKASAFSLEWGIPLDEGAEVLKISFVIDQQMVDRYAEVSGDHNPIHVDPVYAANTPFGGTIAHGLCTMSLISRVVDRWSHGRLSESGELDFSFVGPVPTGSTIDISGVVENSDIGSVLIKVKCSVGKRIVLVGTIKVDKIEKEMVS